MQEAQLGQKRDCKLREEEPLKATATRDKEESKQEEEYWTRMDLNTALGISTELGPAPSHASFALSLAYTLNSSDQRLSYYTVDTLSTTSRPQLCLAGATCTPIFSAKQLV